MPYNDDDYVSPQQTYEAMVTSLSDRIFEDLRVHAQMVNTTPETLLHAVMAQLVGEESRSDARHRDWRVRLRIYDYARGLNEPISDSDPNRAAHFDGETVIRGLKDVIRWIGETASAYHNAPCFGLETHVLKRKIGGLRAQMTNRGDNTGVIRADYQVRSAGQVRHLMVRCDVAKVTPESDTLNAEE